MYSCSAGSVDPMFCRPKVKNTTNTSAIEPFIYSCSAN